MRNLLRYNQQDLGWINSYVEERVVKFSLEMAGINELEQLFNLPDWEILELGVSLTSFKDFKDSILSRTKRIYLFPHEYTLDPSLK